jgi:fumarate hydratase subunit alpha
MTASCDLPQDVLSALVNSYQTETSPLGKSILDQVIKNASIAANDRLPICQDTGTAVFFVTMGNDVYIDGGLITDAVNDGTKAGYKEGYLRNSIVNDPLFDRKNTGNNTPASIHIDFVKGPELTISHLPKGGGCENMSALAMLKPSDGKEGIIDFVVSTIKKAGGNPCPPVIAGIGIGGTADKVSLIAKKALLRPIGKHNDDPRYAEFEMELLEHINNSNVGPQGLGGKATAIAVNIEYLPCHIASMPVALNLNCHAARLKTVTL